MNIVLPVGSFCDSIKYFPSFQKFNYKLCYKYPYVYKLRIDSNVEIFSRHLIEKENFEYENISFTRDEFIVGGYFLTRQILEDTLKIIYHAPEKTDSIKLVIYAQNGEIAFKKTVLGNIIKCSLNEIEKGNSFEIEGLHFISSKEGNLIHVTTQIHSIGYPSLIYFIENPIDSIYIKFKRLDNLIAFPEWESTRK
mgnify:CR=1 FL=1